MKWSENSKIKAQTTDGSLMNKLEFSGATDVDCRAVAVRVFFFFSCLMATLLKSADRIKNLKGWGNYFQPLSAHNLTDRHKIKTV